MTPTPSQILGISIAVIAFVGGIALLSWWASENAANNDRLSDDEDWDKHDWKARLDYLNALTFAVGVGCVIVFVVGLLIASGDIGGD